MGAFRSTCFDFVLLLQFVDQRMLFDLLHRHPLHHGAAHQAGIGRNDPDSLSRIRERPC